MIEALWLINTGSKKGRRGISAGWCEAHLDRSIEYSGIYRRNWILCILSYFQQAFSSSLLLFNVEKSMVVPGQDIVGH